MNAGRRRILLVTINALVIVALGLSLRDVLYNGARQHIDTVQHEAERVALSVIADLALGGAATGQTAAALDARPLDASAAEASAHGVRLVAEGGVPYLIVEGHRTWHVPWSRFRAHIMEQTGVELVLGLSEGRRVFTGLPQLTGPPLFIERAKIQVDHTDPMGHTIRTLLLCFVWVIFALPPLLIDLGRGVLQRREAATARATRDEMLSRFSHELRTPAAAVQSLLGTLASGAVKAPDEQQQFVEVALGEAERLSHGMRRLLMAARGEGQLPLAPQDVDLVPWAQGVTARWAPQIDDLRLAVPETCPARTDLRQLDEAIDVLLDNARKYGAPPVTIALTAGRRVRITVEDAGDGIATAERASVFERLVRGGEHRGEGFGLGLWLAREVARAHGGDLTLEGKSRFVLELPG